MIPTVPFSSQQAPPSVNHAAGRPPVPFTPGQPSAPGEAGIFACRYRYAAGCTAEFRAQPGRDQHEKVAHKDNFVNLTACPACPERFSNSMKRALHLARDHDIAAGTARRSELDARQIREILAARETGTAQPAALPPAPVPVSEQAAPEIADPLDAVRSVITELQALRAENAELKGILFEIARLAGKGKA